MTQEDRTRWNERYQSGDAPIEAKPNRFLAAHAQIVDDVATARRRTGETPAALDLACGAGGTVLWFAQRGWRAVGVDVSDAALALAQEAAERLGVSERVAFIHADLDVWRPPANAFDCVTCFYFLDRRLWPWLRAAVRPGGLLAMQTFHRGALKIRPNSNPDYLLEEGELAQLVSSWGWRLLATADDETAQTTEAILAQRPEAVES
ncbi:class I SAM-dependent methyltransferase [Caldilinea sp.]|jgi:tellurite methyltransferase|uniref:class I SAM-dependent methyltransferase n=1 Tax=Caldilinea sp. TaxID=2293560 RepID=UPI002609C96B|nr:class I SAM-dependent methyltransferase [uncultured Caldilinea sp.]